MKKIIYIFFLLITSASLFSQPITWQRTYGDQFTDFAFSVVQLPDEGYLIAGRRINKASVMRVNKYGDTVWLKTYNSSIFNTIQKTVDGNYIMCGYARHIIKIDIDGNIIWSRQPGSSSGQTSNLITTVDKGFILVGGYSIGYANVPYLIKIDSLGNFEWEKIFINIYGGYGKDIVQSEDLGFTFCGEGTLNAFIIHTDSFGNQIWIKYYSNIYFLSSILLMQDGGYSACGINYILRTEPNGNLRWIRYYTFLNNLEPNSYSMVNTIDNGYAMTGHLDTGYATLFVTLIKTDSLGYLQWYKLFGFNDLDYGECIIQTSDSGYVICGNRENYNNGDAYVIKTDKYGYANPPIGIIPVSNYIPIKTLLYQNYPNPFNNTTIIKFQIQQKGFVKVQVYDVLGREVSILLNKHLSVGEYQLDFNASNLSSGIYFLNLIFNNIFINSKKMILLK